MGEDYCIDQIWSDEKINAGYPLEISLLSSEMGKKYVLTINEYNYFFDKRKARKLIEQLKKIYKIR